MPDSTLASHPARITIGLVDFARTAGRRPAGLRPAGRLPPARYALPDARELRVAVPDRRAVDEACRVRLAVPPRERAAPLGARVAMVPTVARPAAGTAHAARRVGRGITRQRGFDGSIAVA